MVNYKPMLKRIFIEHLCSSVRYSIDTFWGAHKESILHSLVCHATGLVKLQDGSDSPASSMPENNRSRQKSIRSSLLPTRIPPVMGIREDCTVPHHHRKVRKRGKVLALGVRIRTGIRQLQWLPSSHNKELLSTNHGRKLAFDAIASQKVTKPKSTPLFIYK